MDTETGDGGRASGNRDPRRDQSPPHAGVALTRLGSPDREHIHVPQSAPYAGPLHPRRGVGAGDIQIQFSHVRVSFSLSPVSTHTHSSLVLAVARCACGMCGRFPRLRSMRHHRAWLEVAEFSRADRTDVFSVYFGGVRGAGHNAPRAQCAECGACRWPDLHRDRVGNAPALAWDLGV